MQCERPKENHGSLANKHKLGVFDGKKVEPLRSEECVDNLASCLGVDKDTLIRLGILKPAQ